MIIKYINTIRKCTFFLNMFLFFQTIIIGYIFHSIFRFAIIREQFVNLAAYFSYKDATILFNKKIIFLSDNTLLQNPINIINANLTYQTDIFILIYIILSNSHYGKQISSISSNDKICNMESMILSLIESALVNKTKHCITNINISIKKWRRRSFNTYVINFLEGIAKCDYKKENKSNILPTKTLALSLLIKNKIKYMNDINIVYSCNNRVLNCSNNKELLFKMFDDNVDIYIDINTYKLPDLHHITEWVDELYFKKNKQINTIIKKYINND